jgi:hypothetical protein
MGCGFFRSQPILLQWLAAIYLIAFHLDYAGVSRSAKNTSLLFST